MPYSESLVELDSLVARVDFLDSYMCEWDGDIPRFAVYKDKSVVVHGLVHEVVEEIAPHLDERDRERFDAGLRRVFIDNYAAVPPESIRRVLALRAAGVIDVLALGRDYQMDVGDSGTVIKTANGEHRFQVFIDARGQKALDLTDLPFPRLRDQLLAHSDELPPVGDNYTLMVPEIGGHRIAPCFVQVAEIQAR